MMMRQQTKFSILFLLVGGLLGCLPGKGGGEDPAPVDRPAVAVSSDKEPFDSSRIPEQVALEIREEDVTSPAPAFLPVDRALRLAPYEEAFVGHPSSETILGFDRVTFRPATGLESMGFDLRPAGEATWVYGRRGEPVRTVRVRRFEKSVSARNTLRSALTGYQAVLERIEVGDLGFALFQNGEPVRILFTRGNLFLQVGSLGSDSCRLLAEALDHHALVSGLEEEVETLTRPSFRFEQSVRVGIPARITIEGWMDEMVGLHFETDEVSAITTHAKRAWFLSGKPGLRGVVVRTVDRWLRTGSVRFEVEVLPELRR